MDGKNEGGNRTVAGRVADIGVEPAPSDELLMIAYLTERDGSTVRVRMTLSAHATARLQRQLTVIGAVSQPPADQAM